MTAIDNTPVNKNFLSPLNFVFQIKRSPHLNFFIQKVNLPSLSLDVPQQPTPFAKIWQTGDHLTYGSLDVEFIVDEDLQNWFEVHNWLRSLGFPDNFTEYSQIAQQTPTSGKGVRSDISLVLLNAVKIPKWEISFREAFPVSLSALEFGTTEQDVSYITAKASFRYILYDVNQINP
jgi:hypothetical protein